MHTLPVWIFLLIAHFWGIGPILAQPAQIEISAKHPGESREKVLEVTNIEVEKKETNTDNHSSVILESKIRKGSTGRRKSPHRFADNTPITRNIDETPTSQTTSVVSKITPTLTAILICGVITLIAIGIYFFRYSKRCR